MRGLAVAFAGLTGCAGAFDIDPLTYVPPDAAPDAPRYPGQVIHDPAEDYDSDGLPNATDLCVLIPATEAGGRADTDNDGVGDLCDPNPTQGADCLVLFDSFDAPVLAPAWQYDGQVVTREADGYLSIPPGDETLVYLGQPLEISSLEIEAYVTYGANGPGDRFAVQAFTDVTRSPAANGTACSLESDQTFSRVAIAEVTAGVDQLQRTAPLDDLLVAAGSSALLRWRADGCQGQLFTADNGASNTVATPPPAGGVFGLRTLLVGLNVYVIAGYGRGCGT